MKNVLRILLILVSLVVLMALLAYADGAALPVNHSVSVTGTVRASPDNVFALITDIGAAPTWRHEVKSVEILPKDHTRDAWVEDLGHGVKMTFLAVTSTLPDAAGHALRQVELKDTSYGGTWTYDVAPGPTAGTSVVKITEDGYIKPPIYRFMMEHVFGPTRNLDQYMTDLRAAAPQ